jgi:hypothetical protein
MVVLTRSPLGTSRTRIEDVRVGRIAADDRPPTPWCPARPRNRRMPVTPRHVARGLAVNHAHVVRRTAVRRARPASRRARPTHGARSRGFTARPTSPAGAAALLSIARHFVRQEERARRVEAVRQAAHGAVHDPVDVDLFNVAYMTSFSTSVKTGRWSRSLCPSGSRRRARRADESTHRDEGHERVDTSHTNHRVCLLIASIIADVATVRETADSLGTCACWAWTLAQANRYWRCPDETATLLASPWQGTPRPAARPTLIGR